MYFAHNSGRDGYPMKILVRDISPPLHGCEYAHLMTPGRRSLVSGITTLTDDPAHLKLTTGSRVLDTTHASLLAVCYYYYSVTHFADYGALERPHWSVLSLV